MSFGLLDDRTALASSPYARLAYQDNWSQHCTHMSQIKALGPDLEKKISIVLGREIMSSEAGNVASFNDFSPGDIDEFRALDRRSGILAVSFIRFRLSGNVELSTVTSYYAAVIQHGIPVNEWNATS